MKDKSIIGAILTMVGLYLLLSFVIWDLNPKHWSMEARLMYAVWGPMLSILVYAGIKLR
jgi:hypothetical protein